jgi:uncharacterized membrane protein
MASASLRSRSSIHPVHAVLLASSLPLFLGTLLSDWAYSATYEVQWINFAAWLIAGALLFAGLALAWAVVDAFQADVRNDPRRLLYLLVLLATFVVGVFDALAHGRDAWATMPSSLVLSLMVTLLALASVALGFSTLRSRAGR